MAPTKANTANTASTFSFKAESTSRASLTVDVKAIVTSLRRKPKQESCCSALTLARKCRDGQGGATKYLTIRAKFPCLKRASSGGHPDQCASGGCRISDL